MFILYRILLSGFKTYRKCVKPIESVYVVSATLIVYAINYKYVICQIRLELVK
jgi:hypothetical protein